MLSVKLSLKKWHNAPKLETDRREKYWVQHLLPVMRILRILSP
jgi:hypothetical protein